MAEQIKRPQPEPIEPTVNYWRERLDWLRPPPGQWPTRGTVPVSVLVPVKNEQRNVVECLRRLSWAEHIVVVDSQSTDDTIVLAQAMGAEVYQFHYDREVGWPKKKNWAIENVSWRHDWLLIMDADEYMTPELALEICEVVTGKYLPNNARVAGSGDGYWLNRRFMFMGRWIRHGGYYPSYNVRLFKHRLGRYERIGNLGDTGSGDNEVHEHLVMSTGEPGFLRNDFLHYAYPDLTTWVEKHNRYSTWEAHALRAKGGGHVKARLFGDPVARRRWLKARAASMPFRPTLRFFYCYVLKFGFLDGYPGFVMARLMAWYEFISIAKLYEMNKAALAQNVASPPKFPSNANPSGATSVVHPTII